MGQGLRTGLGHEGITCVLQTQFSSYKDELQLYGRTSMVRTLMARLQWLF